MLRLPFCRLLLSFTYPHLLRRLTCSTASHSPHHWHLTFATEHYALRIRTNLAPLVLMFAGLPTSLCVRSNALRDTGKSRASTMPRPSSCRRAMIAALENIPPGESERARIWTWPHMHMRFYVLPPSHHWFARLVSLR